MDFKATPETKTNSMSLRPPRGESEMKPIERYNYMCELHVAFNNGDVSSEEVEKVFVTYPWLLERTHLRSEEIDDVVDVSADTVLKNKLYTIDPVAAPLGWD